MYSLQRVSDNYSNYELLSDFYSDLPSKPYCSDVKNACMVRPKQTASKLPYIQPNHPQIIRWLFIDIDSDLKHTQTAYYDENLFFRYHDRNLPPPTIIMRNPLNGHVQYAYKLTDPVTMFENSRGGPTKYLKAIQYALTVQLGGDLSFGGSLAKNPLSDKWEVYLTGANSYTLAELNESLDLTDPQNKPQKKSQNDDKISEFAGLGRNCDTFDYLRFIAYSIAHKMTYTALYNHLLALAMEFNSRFKQPLLYNEIRCICRSIAKFCKSSPKYQEYTKLFSEKQAEKGRKGGLKSDSSQGGKARSASYDDQRTQAQNLRATGLSIRKIAEQMKVSKTSVQKWIKVC